jgi:hypothetical protein
MRGVRPQDAFSVRSRAVVGSSELIHREQRNRNVLVQQHHRTVARAPRSPVLQYAAVADVRRAAEDAGWRVG